MQLMLHKYQKGYVVGVIVKHQTDRQDMNIRHTSKLAANFL